MHIFLIFTLLTLTRTHETCTDFCYSRLQKPLSTRLGVKCNCYPKIDDNDSVNDYDILSLLEIEKTIEDIEIYYEPVENVFSYGLNNFETPTMKEKSQLQSLEHKLHSKYPKLGDEQLLQLHKGGSVLKVDKTEVNILFKDPVFLKRNSDNMNKVPIYLDIDISTLQRNYSFKKEMEVKSPDIKITEDQLIECIDLHILLFLFKNKRLKLKRLLAENKISKYGKIAESDIMLEIETKCKMPNNIVKESVKEIKRWSTNKSNQFNSFLIDDRDLSFKDDSTVISSDDYAKQSSISQILIDTTTDSMMQRKPSYDDIVASPFDIELSKIISNKNTNDEKQLYNDTNEYNIFLKGQVKSFLRNNNQKNVIVNATQDTTLDYYGQISTTVAYNSYLGSSGQMNTHQDLRNTTFYIQTPTRNKSLHNFEESNSSFMPKSSTHKLNPNSNFSQIKHVFNDENTSNTNEMMHHVMRDTGNTSYNYGSIQGLEKSNVYDELLEDSTSKSYFQTQPSDSTSFIPVNTTDVFYPSDKKIEDINYTTLNNDHVNATTVDIAENFSSVQTELIPKEEMKNEDYYPTNSYPVTSNNITHFIKPLNPHRREYVEGEYNLPKIITKERVNNIVQSTIDGYENLPNDDFIANNITNIDLQYSVSTNSNVYHNTSSGISGTLYFVHGENYMPASFVQNKGKINLELDVKRLCDTLLQTDKIDYSLFAILCRCVQNQNCTNYYSNN